VASRVHVTFVSIRICGVLDILRPPNFSAFSWRGANRAGPFRCCIGGQARGSGKVPDRRLNGTPTSSVYFSLSIGRDRPRRWMLSGLICVWVRVGSDRRSYGGSCFPTHGAMMLRHGWGTQFRAEIDESKSRSFDSPSLCEGLLRMTDSGRFSLSGSGRWGCGPRLV
jgi:hypothetical protein